MTDHKIGAPALPHGTTETTQVPHGEAHGPALLGLDAEGWVYVGLTIFLLIALFVAKAPKRVAEVLDARIAETRRSLDEARALRAEAEQLVTDAKAKVAASVGDAQRIVAHAENEAKHLIEDAQAQAAELTRRRSQMAEDKISAAERSAVAEVRARAAEAAAGIAGRVIAQSHDVNADRALVDGAISRV